MCLFFNYNFKDGKNYECEKCPYVKGACKNYQGCINYPNSCRTCLLQQDLCSGCKINKAFKKYKEKYDKEVNNG